MTHQTETESLPPRYDKVYKIWVMSEIQKIVEDHSIEDLVGIFGENYALSENDYEVWLEESSGDERNILEQQIIHDNVIEAKIKALTYPNLKAITEHEDRAVDEDNNTSFYAYFEGKEHAMAALKSLRNCTNCTDCLHCVNCHGCNHCYRGRNLNNISICEGWRINPKRL